MQPLTDDQVRFTALRNGDVDMVDKIPFAEGGDVLKGSISGMGVSMGEAAGHNRLRMNVRRPPLSDVRVRQAIAFALNKQEIMQAATWGLGRAIYWRYPKNTRWFIEMDDRKQDLKKAKALLGEAGLGRGFRLSLPIHTASLPAGQVVQAQLTKIGIEVNLQTMDRGAYRDRIRKRDYDIVISGGGMAPDPDSILYDAFHSKFVDHQNESGYQNPDLDRVLEEARVIADFDKRKMLYTEALRTLMRDVPEIPLYTYPWIFGFRNHVKGFEAEETRGVLSHNSNRGGIPVTWLDR
jgi:peptide/nickel transport system substrate-binding protein